MIFDQHGFAIESGFVRVYAYDENFIFTHSDEIWIAVGTTLPELTTLIAPDFEKGFTAIFDINSQQWNAIEDHRGTRVYSIHDQSESVVDYVGPIKSGFTKKAPNFFETWNGTEWVDQRTAEEIAAYNRLQFQKLSKRQFALYLYDHDMYDQVMQAIEANPRFKIEYDTVSDIERLSPTVAEVSKLLNWTDEHVDAMWSEALTL